MSRFVSSTPVRSRVGDCQCPGSPHAEGDWIDLRPTLSLDAGLTAMAEYRAAIMDPAFDVEAFKSVEGETPETLTPEVVTARIRGQNVLARALFPIFVRHGLVGWNFLNDDGEAMPCTEENAATLDFPTRFKIADLADDIYGVTVINPLAEQIERLSDSGPTVVSISPNRASRRHPPQRSARSSRGTSGAMAASDT